MVIYYLLFILSDNGYYLTPLIRIGIIYYSYYLTMVIIKHNLTLYSVKFNKGISSASSRSELANTEKKYLDRK